MPHAVVSRSVVSLLVALLLLGLSPVPPPAPLAPPPPDEVRDGPQALVAGLGIIVGYVGALVAISKVTGEDEKSETKSGDEEGTKAGGEGADPDTDTDEEVESSSSAGSPAIIVPLGAEEGVLLERNDTGPWYRFSHTGRATASATSAQVTYETISAEADVLRTDEDVREVAYVQGQTHTFRVERTSRGGEARAQVSLTIDEVRLSTIDIPGTYGYSTLTMSISVAGREVYSATASVAQAQEPVVSKDFTYKSIEAQKDLLILRGVEQTLDLKLPNRRTFDIAVTYRLEGVGQRL